MRREPPESVLLQPSAPALSLSYSFSELCCSVVVADGWLCSALAKPLHRSPNSTQIFRAPFSLHFRWWRLKTSFFLQIHKHFVHESHRHSLRRLGLGLHAVRVFVSLLLTAILHTFSPFRQRNAGVRAQKRNGVDSPICTYRFV